MRSDRPDHIGTERYNVDVIPYRISDGSHHDLHEVLEAYGSFIVGRSLSFGQAPRRAPSYDPETTGLFIYNTLVLREGSSTTPDALLQLLSARILSLAKFKSRNMV